MLAYVLVALGSAVGGVCRFALAGLLDRSGPDGFPWGTLAVNIVGCAIIGLIGGLRDHLWVYQLLMAGLLGGFTTFSAFSLQTITLARDGRWGAAGTYLGLSVVCCLVGCWLGWMAGGFLGLRAK